MKPQTKIVLSLGSNLKDRKSILQQAIYDIHEDIATVVRVSALYETEAWGFSSEPFYNCCVLIHTTKSANSLLKSFQKLEKESGRLPKKNEDNYEARTLDIDIISVEQEEVNLPHLQVPHPQMQNRNFVLIPFLDVNQSWEHPVFSKSVKTLLSECTDKGSCNKIGALEMPLSNFVASNFNYIAIEGNIGSGKTTLATKIAEDTNAKLVLERFADNPFLPKFYKEPTRFAFPLEMSFLADRYKQLTDDLSQYDLFKEFVVADYYIFKSLIFAKVTLQEDEYKLYKTLFDIMYKEIPKPELYVYLYQNTERLLQNIKKRGRSYEKEIDAVYLDKINNGYLEYIKTQQDLKVLVIDISELDFVKYQKDYVAILQKIEEKINATN